MFNVDGIERALREGFRLRAFRSGGGLRVVSLERGTESRGYGEAPNIEEALVHLNEDYLAGGRPYKDVYGPSGKYPHYLTGSSHSPTSLDAWVCAGHAFDAWCDISVRAPERRPVVAQLGGYVFTRTPKDVQEKILNGADPIKWTDHRGFVYETAACHGGYSSQMVSAPAGRESGAHMYYATRTGKAASFWDAIAAAFDAPEVEP